MKLLLVLTVLAPAILGACTHPLEQVMEQHRQERVSAAYANRPITAGSGDGLGHIIADSAANGLTVSTQPAAK